MDAAAAYAALRSLLTSSGITLPLRWQNEDNGELPDTPTAFAFVQFLGELAFLASFGGGSGNNRYRNPGRLDIYVFVPRDQGLSVALSNAETIATVIRSYRTGDLSCREASVIPGGNGAMLSPPGIGSEVNNYFWALVVADLSYDQIG